jgi:hypothetical protein
MKPYKTSVTLTIELSADIEFEGYATPGTPDVFYLSNGDPGYPGSSPEFQVTKAIWNGVDITEALKKDKDFDWQDIELQCVNNFIEED